jgi:pyruvate formate lyase activating enzyme
MENGTENQTGTIFRIAHYTIHDGPGIRTTVFLKGCPARCLWCCSPESQLSGPEMARRADRCLSCESCSGDPEKCPGEALERIGRQVSPEELLAEVMRDAPFWRRSGGGVTVSGGEPLAQPGFLTAFLKLCKGRYIHTAIETSLFCSRPTLERVSGLLDFIQFDLKAMDPRLHRELTGLDNGEMLDNARFLLRSGKPILARIPLVPGCNDGEDNLRALGAFLGEQRPGAELEILAYHRMGVGRYEDLGREYALPVTKPPEREEMERAERILREYPIKVTRQGGHKA